MNIYKVFVYMFYALDAEYDENPNEILGDYLSGLNPFLFKEECSADPAEFEEFKKSYIKCFGNTEPDCEDVYDFCRDYLEKNAPKEIVQAFSQTKKEDWIFAFEIKGEIRHVPNCFQRPQ